MAEHTHTTYSCDRCKADLGEKRPKRNQSSTVDASFNWTEGPGPNFKWRDLCDPCDIAVRAFFLTSPLDLNVTLSERREARAWFAEVLAYVNTEMGEYIMARARRMVGGWKP